MASTRRTDPVLRSVLACPDCGGELRSTEDDQALACRACQATFPIVNDVPRLNVALDEHQLTNVAKTFSFEWNAHYRGEFESDTLFGRTRTDDWAMVTQAMDITDEDVRGAVVLDAGCGSGRFCELFADHGARAVIGVDMNEAVEEAASHCREYENIHIVQGNIFQLPFKAGVFDLVWCNGVLHHTPDAAGAYRALTRHVRPEGILYVWVYPDRFNPFRFTKSLLRFARPHCWHPAALQLLSTLLAYLSVALLKLYRLVRSLPPLRPRSAWGTRTVRARTVPELKLTWFDALSPEFDTRHSEVEVVGWFRDLGFHDIKTLEEPKVGVRGVAPAA